MIILKSIREYTSVVEYTSVLEYTIYIIENLTQLI